ncbi:helix-turn-helix transcriptional regulator [Vitiosangium sp. GDMCC 1.1324]|uniref:ArsR/SmtB family transcription factor n=1 Tax=Vitiosangium sp. (strain GDMCC 1.1324) TaxID=2138576 RepID=UPI000D39CD58|nr:metalloregulator ArsR/SmtB family transcription factor [Vitiosangium sp. GDMCC 1.1324]PTL82007.1 transcriptional regulator [Vitiosangium sp. GDMCC 1.1324]
MRRHPSAPSWKDSAPLFAALGDETRLRVVARLCEEGPLSITRLTEGADVSRQAVTKHLQVLASAGLVKNARDGRENVWQLEPRRLEEARRLLDLISREWDDTLGRLKDFVEK